MLAATPCSRWLASPAKTISMRLISVMDHPHCCHRRLTARSFKPKATPGNGHGRGGRKSESVTLDPEQSAALREQLLTQVGNITSVDLAAAWAREALTAKNSLAAADAKLVEDAFERRLSELPSSDAGVPSNDDSLVPQIARTQVTAPAEGTAPDRAQRIDKSILTVAPPRHMMEARIA